jgi:hypothetical protein
LVTLFIHLTKTNRQRHDKFSPRHYCPNPFWLWDAQRG